MTLAEIRQTLPAPPERLESSEGVVSLLGMLSIETSHCGASFIFHPGPFNPTATSCDAHPCAAGTFTSKSSSNENIPTTGSLTAVTDACVHFLLGSSPTWGTRRGRVERATYNFHSRVYEKHRRRWLGHVILKQVLKLTVHSRSHPHDMEPCNLGWTAPDVQTHKHCSNSNWQKEKRWNLHTTGDIIFYYNH